MIYTVLNLKGGPGKTTTSVMLCAGMNRRGRRTALVDADPQGSAIGWSEQAELDFLTVAMPTRSIHKQVDQLMNNSTDLVIDTPPGDLGIVMSAARAAAAHAGVLLIPMQPTTADLMKLPETLSLADEAAAFGDVQTFILLTRVVPRTRTRIQAREALADRGVQVLDAEIRNAQAVATAAGQPVEDLGDYDAVLTELEQKVKVSR